MLYKEQGKKFWVQDKIIKKGKKEKKVYEEKLKTWKILIDAPSLKKEKLNLKL